MPSVICDLSPGKWHSVWESGCSAHMQYKSWAALLGSLVWPARLLLKPVNSEVQYECWSCWLGIPQPFTFGHFASKHKRTSKFSHLKKTQDHYGAWSSEADNQWSSSWTVMLRSNPKCWEFFRVSRSHEQSQHTRMFGIGAHFRRAAWIKRSEQFASTCNISTLLKNSPDDSWDERGAPPPPPPPKAIKWSEWRKHHNLSGEWTHAGKRVGIFATLFGVTAALRPSHLYLFCLKPFFLHSKKDSAPPGTGDLGHACQWWHVVDQWHTGNKWAGDQQPVMCMASDLVLRPFR